MDRLFGFIGNRSDLGSRVLDVDPEAIVTASDGSRLGWGVGFYQGGEVLLRRRPVDDRATIDVASLARGVRTDALLGSVRAPSVGEPQTENTQPFRYRDWVMVHQGKVNAFDRLRSRWMDSIPGFLQGNVRGETDSELVFYLYLSFLHDAGMLLGPTPPSVAVDALRGTCALVDRLACEEGAEGGGDMAMLVCNGEYIAGLARGVSMAIRRVRGEDDIDALLLEDALRSRRLPDMARVRFTILATGVGESRDGWTKTVAQSTVVVDRLHGPVVETF